MVRLPLTQPLYGTPSNRACRKYPTFLHLDSSLHMEKLSIAGDAREPLYDA